jgi:hypothetical protein
MGMEQTVRWQRKPRVRGSERRIGDHWQGRPRGSSVDETKVSRQSQDAAPFTSSGKPESFALVAADRAEPFAGCRFARCAAARSGRR